MNRLILLLTFIFLNSFLFSQENDEITNSFQIYCGDQISSSTSGSNSDQEYLLNVGLADCGTTVDTAPGVWYSFIGTDEIIQLNMCGSNYDTKLHVFQDDGFNLICIAGNDDSDCENYLHSKINFFSEYDANYFIYVSGWGGLEGDFTMSVNCAIPGCLDSTACNYNDQAVEDDGSCYYPNECNSCDDDLSCYGCTDISGLNYSEENTIEDGSCEYSTICSDGQELAFLSLVFGNWTSEITWDIQNQNGNIIANSPALNTWYQDYETYGQYLCLNANETYTFNSYDTYGDGWNGGVYSITICDLAVILANNNGEVPSGYGITEEFIINSIDCGSYGCTNPEACNYDPNASIDYGCIVSDGITDCLGNCFNDLNENGICDENDIYGCMDESVINFNPDATFDNGSCIYELECSNNEIQIDVLLSTDNYPWETSFVLNNNDGVVWANEDEVFTDLYTDYLFQYCLPNDGCYVFTVYDSYGDGIFDSGGLQVFYEEDLVLENPDFDSEAAITMNCPPGYDCNTAIEVDLGNYVTESNDYWYVYTPEENGQYNINTCSSECNTVIYVYDYCTGLLPTESNDATIYYNDDECGLQSEVFPLFSANQTYYIRINGDCENIEWEISYTGPVEGCMDTTACNYNPIAEIEDNSCIYPGDPNCTSGPDLMVLPFEDSMYLEVYENNDGCAIEEGCINGYGTRYIVRFTTWIKNIGDQDYFIGSVQDTEETNQFEWDECHNHWHYKGYAEYVLFDEQGQLIPVGFKNGFCVMDLECSDGGTFTYGCSVMGISAGCGDIYGAGLGCQWIDITNVEDGDYTMVVRTNWDQDPDALGNVELTYENNWAQTCIRVITLEDGSKSYVIATDLDNDGIENINDPDIDGDGIMNNDDDDIDNDGIMNNDDDFPYGMSECPSYTDCNGEEFGNAQLDCNGVCGGESVTGDLNLDGFTDIFDGQQYINDIISEDITASNCTDLDMDGEITVSDVGLLVNCINNSPSITRDNQSEPCEFGMEITNPNHVVTLGIDNINFEQGYLDVTILNPDNEVLGYQFTMGNILITNVENLIDDYNIEPAFSYGSNSILGISLENQLIEKNYDPVPLCRVYFELPLGFSDNIICIENIIDIVNEDYENVTYINNTDECDEINIFDINEYDGVSLLNIYPNPTSNDLYISVSFNEFQSCNIFLFDILGNKVFEENINSQKINTLLDTSSLTQGVYNLTIEYEFGTINNKLIIQR
ncbi:MAG: hypothetical protein CMP74_03610 [Flavobacteriales bacterium]|nr:hypothetical protein [Flavobacteriales bacterium]